MYRIIHKNFSHHTTATPIDTVVNWKVYNFSDVPYGWPDCVDGSGHRLALEADQAQLDYLAQNDVLVPDELWPIPPKSTPKQ